MAHGPVAPVVVVGLGHNTLWERDRANFDRWASKFDTEAEALIEALRSLGAKKIVWVTLREAGPESVPQGWLDQYERYNWYFPYVNERLGALVRRHPDITLADWAAVSTRLGVTYDSMHLTTEGANLMAEVIAAGIGIDIASTDAGRTRDRHPQ